MVTRRGPAKPYEIMQKARAGITLARRKRHVWEKGKGT
jgi:hypothetical protein